MEKNHRMGKALFFCYCCVMLWLLFGQRVGEGVASNINLKPLRTIRNYLYVLRRTEDPQLLQHIVVNLAGNIIMFIPLGFFLPVNWKSFHFFPKTILVTTGIICAVEMIQHLTALGSMDIDDLILNMLGVLLGYLLCLAFFRRKS